MPDAPSQLLRLPSEVLDIILSFTDTPDLVKIVTTCSKLYGAATPFLYHTLKIHTDNWHLIVRGTPHDESIRLCAPEDIAQINPNLISARKVNAAQFSRPANRKLASLRLVRKIVLEGMPLNFMVDAFIDGVHALGGNAAVAFLFAGVRSLVITESACAHNNGMTFAMAANGRRTLHPLLRLLKMSPLHHLCLTIPALWYPYEWPRGVNRNTKNHTDLDGFLNQIGYHKDVQHRSFTEDYFTYARWSFGWLIEFNASQRYERCCVHNACHLSDPPMGIFLAGNTSKPKLPTFDTERLHVWGALDSGMSSDCWTQLARNCSALSPNVELCNVPSELAPMLDKIPVRARPETCKNEVARAVGGGAGGRYLTFAASVFCGDDGCGCTEEVEYSEFDGDSESGCIGYDKDSGGEYMDLGECLHCNSPSATV